MREVGKADTGEESNGYKDREFRSVTIQSERRLPLPDDLRPLIRESSDAPVTYWSHETNMELPIISDQRLSKPQYETIVQPYKIMDGNRVQIPSTIVDISGSSFAEGETVYFIGVGEMVTGEGPNSLYVLTEWEIWNYLVQPDNRDTRADEDVSLRSIVLDTAPAFFPKPK